jgi:amino acid transporter
MATSASVGTPPATSSGLFTRQSSGLVRELGVPAATAIALASVAVVNTFINFNAGLVSFSQVDMVLPLLLGAGIWFVAMFAYKYLLEAIPRAGGEYVYLSRIISPAAGAVIGISTAIAFTYTLSANANFFASYVPFALTSLGAAFNSSSISNAAGNVTSQSAVAIIGVSMLVVVGICSIFSLRRLAQVILGLVIFQLVAFLVLGFLLATHSHSDFVTALGQFSGHPTAYNDILAAAKKDNIPLGVSLGTSILVVPFMVLNYNGVLYSYYVGGELKRPGRTYLYASVISIALLIVVWVGVWLLMLNTVDMAFVAVTTRVLFALAFDRLLPIGLAKVSERNASPVNAIILAVLVGIGFTILGSLVSLANIVANIALFFALILLAGSLAAVFLPLRRPDLIKKAGATDIPRVGGIPTATLWGSASTILALFTVGLIVTNPSVFGALTFLSVASLVIVLVSGPVIYLIARQIRLSRSSIDLRLAMRELPPE